MLNFRERSGVCRRQIFPSWCLETVFQVFLRTPNLMERPLILLFQIHMKVQRRIHPQLFGSIDDIGFTQQMREWSRFQPMSFREGNEDHPLQIGGNGGSQTWNTFHAYVFAKIDVPPLISSVLQTLCFRMRIDHKGWVIRSWWEELEHFSTRLWMVLVWHLLRWE